MDQKWIFEELQAYLLNFAAKWCMISIQIFRFKLDSNGLSNQYSIANWILYVD